MTEAAPTRRSILALIGLAPIAVPAMAAAAARPTFAAVAGASASLRGGALLTLEETASLPWSAADVAAYRQSRLITWPDGPEKDAIDREWRDFTRERAARGDAARAALAAGFAPCPILIDDAGGGP